MHLHRGDPRLVIVDVDHLEHVRAADRTAMNADALSTPAGAVVNPDALPFVAPWDVHAIVYTSGTTGNSKGSLTTHVHMTTMAAWITESGSLTSEDVWLGDLPLFHLAALVNSTLMMRVRSGTRGDGPSERARSRMRRCSVSDRR